MNLDLKVKYLLYSRRLTVEGEEEKYANYARKLFKKKKKPLLLRKKKCK